MAGLYAGAVRVVKGPAFPPRCAGTALHTVAMNSRIRPRVAASGSVPNAVCAFSSMWCGLLVSVSTQVTAGLDRMYFSENWAHVLQPASAAHGGSGLPSSRLK